MTDISNISRLGVTDGTTNGSWEQDNALFLKKFSGEVMNAFAEKNVMMARHIIRTLDSGKVAQFPATWKTNAQYHVPGTPLLGNNTVKHNERLIYADDMLESDIFISKIDELKNHYDVRAEYSRQMGQALAREFDKRVQQVGIRAARAAATVDGGFGGSEVTEADARTDGNKLAATFFTAAEKLDEKDVDAEDRFALIKPAQYYLLVQAKDTINKDWGGAGMYADGSIYRIADIEPVKTNNLPQTNVASTVAGENNDYTGDFSNVAALIMNRTAVGTVKMLDLTTQMADGDFAVMYQGVLLVAKYVMGHGILRPECAVEVNVTAN